jgi:hypothetical protein
MAPPARQTKSAEWALTTSAVFVLLIIGGLFCGCLIELTFAFEVVGE